jgi:Mg2+ and Co2+ transporter CorA
MSDFAALIKETDADKFDRALTELGKMLGFDSEKPEGDGTPDSVWRIGGEFVLLFESKSDETPAGKISISTCRQAQGHLDWVQARPLFTQNAKLCSIIVTPRMVLDKAAVAHAKELRHQSLESIRTLFREAEACLRLIRSKSPDLETEQRLRVIQEELEQAQLTPEAVVKRVTSSLVSELSIK